MLHYRCLTWKIFLPDFQRPVLILREAWNDERLGQPHRVQAQVYTSDPKKDDCLERDLQQQFHMLEVYHLGACRKLDRLRYIDYQELCNSYDKQLDTKYICITDQV